MCRWWINGLEWSPLRSDHFQRKNYLYFANRENLRIFPVGLSTVEFLRKTAFPS